MYPHFEIGVNMNKNMHFRLEEDFHSMMKELSGKHKINWSRKITQFLKDEVNRIKQEEIAE